MLRIAYLALLAFGMIAPEVAVLPSIAIAQEAPPTPPPQSPAPQPTRDCHEPPVTS